MKLDTANKGTFYLTIVLVALTILLVGIAIATLGMVYWVWRYPNAAQAPPLPGGIAGGYWGLSLFLATCLLIAVALQFLIVKLIRGKLRQELAQLRERFAGKTQQAKSAEKERDQAREDAKKWEREYWKAHNDAIPIKTLNENYEQQLDEAKRKLNASQLELRQATANVQAMTQQVREEARQKELTYKLFQDRENQLEDLLWLKKRMEEQATDISEHVMLREAKLWELKFDNDRRAIVVLTIRNESIFDITISAETLKGRLVFNGKPCHDPARIIESERRRPIKDMEPFDTRYLVLEQPLLQSEAERISDAMGDPNARFSLANLKITISVENITQTVEPKPLRFDESVESLYLKDYKNDPLEEIENQSPQPLTMSELRARIDTLPAWKRVKATQLALEAFGEKFFEDEHSTG